LQAEERRNGILEWRGIPGTGGEGKVAKGGSGAKVVEKLLMD
jgi:hypothetical protein